MDDGLPIVGPEIDLSQVFFPCFFAFAFFDFCTIFSPLPD